MSLFDDNYSRFTFTYRCNNKDITINLDRQDATVSEVLEEFMNFLKACGYCFDVNDHIEVVNEYSHSVEMFDDMVSEKEAEANALRDAASWIKYGPNGDITFTLGDYKPMDMIDPEVPPNEPLKWIDTSDGKEYTSHSGFVYKPKDY